MSLFTSPHQAPTRSSFFKSLWPGLLCLLLLTACQQTAAPSPTPVATAITTAPEAATDPSPTLAAPADPPPDTPTTNPTAAAAPATDTAVPPTALPPQTAVTSITLAPLNIDSLTSPVYLTHAQDERLFVVEQPGLIRIITNGTLSEQPFLDLRDRVDDSANEQGLLSLAFHPDYSTNGRFFVNYTNSSGDTTISRFQVSDDPNRADASSETILLTIPQPYRNHNGGQLQFGPDGYLYIGMGDGGSANDPEEHGQNANTLLGGLLRLDVDQERDSAAYSIPATNPFAATAAQGELWAIGLRNPWRFSFDRLTGDMYIADVGQNIWEEVHFQPANSPGGENYGWNILEGNHCFQVNLCDKTGLERPIFEYDHADGCSVTGGYVYRGQQFPSLYGNYFVGDYCSGLIWSLFPETDGTWVNHLVLDSDLLISSFGEGSDGELYVLNHGGDIWQIRP